MPVVSTRISFHATRCEDIKLLNPNTRTCPIFRTQLDAEITKSIYRRVPVLIDENKKDGNPWGITFKQGLFNMTSDSSLFRTRQELEEDGYELAEPGNVFTKGEERRSYLPIYESKMFFHYNHRYGDFALLPAGAKGHILPEVPETKLKDNGYVTFPRYWGSKNEVEARLDKKWERSWFLGFRDVTDARASARTVIFDIIPFAGVGNSAPLCFVSPDKIERVPMLLACLSSFALDFVSRPKIGGLHLNFFIAKQLAVLPPETYESPAAWEPESTLSDWISSRVLELTYTAWDLEPFARDLGYDGPPFRWDSERRFVLRCELGAAFFHLYGIGRDDADYIMETFPIVERKDEAAHGEYRTKRVILEIYDAMQKATETGQPYRTPLDPPPADLGASEAGPATVIPLRPRIERTAQAKPPELRPEELPVLDRAAEARNEYAPAEPSDRRAAEPEEQTNGAAEPAPAEEARLPHEAQQPPGKPEDAAPIERAAPEAPNPYAAALALHACVPDGEKVEQGVLLADAARELGHPKLTRKVRRALNKALQAEHNAGRLKTDWQRVWKPGKKK